MSYPPYTITSTALNLVAAISEELALLSASGADAPGGPLSPAFDIYSAPDVYSLQNIYGGGLSPKLRKENRIRTIHASLAIENNTLSLEQVTDIMDGKPVIGPARDIQEVRGAVAAYEKLDAWTPHSLKDMLSAHALLMHDLVEHPGKLRTEGVGVFQGNKVIHMAPPAGLVHGHLENLLQWLKSTDEHSLIASCVFHYEFEFIHPFADGNGRMGRLWQTLILSKWKPVLAYMPVESIVRTRQQEYYGSLGQADAQGEATKFIEFMLRALQDTLKDVQADQVGVQVSDQVRRLLDALGQSEKTAADLMLALDLRHAPTFRKNYLSPALEVGLIERTQPDSPRSPTQRYRLTALGKKTTRDE